MKVFYNKYDMINFVLAINLKQKNIIDDSNLPYINNRDMKFLALAINYIYKINWDSIKEREWESIVHQILNYDLRYVARSIMKKETNIKALNVSKISENREWKLFAIAYNCKECEENDVLVSFIKDEILRYAILAINNNETNKKGKWISKLQNFED